MKIEFVLSPNDYLDLGEHRLRTPSRALGTISAFVSLGLILLGYCLLHFWPERDPRIGLISLMAGLFFAFAAAVLAFFPRQLKSNKSEALLRSEHERFFSDRRTFEFDDVGWNHQSERGEDVRKWPELTSLRESTRAMVLGTSGDFYWLPKSAFTTEGLERIKALSNKALDEPGALFRVRVSSTPKDYVQSMLSYNWRKNWKTVLLSYAAALVLLMVVTDRSTDYSLTKYPVIIIFVFALFLFGECLYYVYLYYQAFRRNAPTDGAIMEDRIGFWAPSRRWVVKYQWLSEIRETPSAFHLYFQPTSFYVIPKKGFDHDQLTRFRELLLARRPPSPEGHVGGVSG